MKILIVCHDNRPYGAMASLSEWVSSLEPQDVMFIYPRKKGDEFKDWLNNRGFSSFCVKYRFCVGSLQRKSIKENIEYFAKMLLWKYYSYTSLKRICKVIQNKHFDCVLSNTSSIDMGARIARRLNIPHVWHIREFLEEDHELTPFDKKEFLTFCKQSCAIFISKCLKESWLEKYSFKDYCVIYNYVSNNNIEKSKKILNNNILMAGRLQENKGQLEAIKSVEYLYKKYGIRMNLYIYGEGPQKNKLDKYINKHELDMVYLCGFSKELNKVRQNIGVCLICSSNEAFGRVTIESMYSRNIVVASKSGANIELVTDGVTGYFYELGDYINLADRLKDIYYLSENSRKKILDEAENYAINNFSYNTVEKILCFIHKVINE